MVSPFLVCVVVVTLSVLLTLAFVLPTRVAGTTPVFLLVEFVPSGTVIAAMSGHAFLPTAERLAVVTERSKVGV